jgi:hypothetical protein
MPLKRTFLFLLLTSLAFAGSPIEPSKQAARLLKEGQTFLSENVWQKRLCVAYRHAKGVGMVVAPKGEEEVARLETNLYDGVFYVALRDKRVYKAVAVDRGRVSGIADVFETHFVRAAKDDLSMEIAEELKKALRTEHRSYVKSFEVPNASQFRAYVIL